MQTCTPLVKERHTIVTIIRLHRKYLAAIAIQMRVIPSRADDEGPPERWWATLDIERVFVSLREVNALPVVAVGGCAAANDVYSKSLKANARLFLLLIMLLLLILLLRGRRGLGSGARS